MGWWSTDILGGDTPLDYVSSFYDVCGVSQFLFVGDSMVKQELTKHHIDSNIVELVNSINEADDDASIGYQVLAVMMMGAGAYVSDTLRKVFLQACANDKWALENEERKSAIDGLTNAISVYDNDTKILIESRGLFEVI